MDVYNRRARQIRGREYQEASPQPSSWRAEYTKMAAMSPEPSTSSLKLLFIYLPIHLSIHPSIHPSIYLCIIHPLSIYIPIDKCWCMCVFLCKAHLLARLGADDSSHRRQKLGETNQGFLIFGISVCNPEHDGRYVAQYLCVRRS